MPIGRWWWRLSVALSAFALATSCSQQTSVDTNASANRAVPTAPGSTDSSLTRSDVPGGSLPAPSQTAAPTETTTTAVAFDTVMARQRADTLTLSYRRLDNVLGRPLSSEDPFVPSLPEGEECASWRDAYERSRAVPGLANTATWEHATLFFSRVRGFAAVTPSSENAAELVAGANTPDAERCFESVWRTWVEKLLNKMRESPEVSVPAYTVSVLDDEQPTVPVPPSADALSVSAFNVESSAPDRVIEQHFVVVVMQVNDSVFEVVFSNVEPQTRDEILRIMAGVLRESAPG